MAMALLNIDQMGALAMNAQVLTMIERLRGRAHHCHRLAEEALSNGIAVELEELARGYERDAAQLEILEPD